MTKPVPYNPIENSRIELPIDRGPGMHEIEHCIFAREDLMPVNAPLFTMEFTWRGKLWRVHQRIVIFSAERYLKDTWVLRGYPKWHELLGQVPFELPRYDGQLTPFVRINKYAIQGRGGELNLSAKEFFLMVEENISRSCC